MDGNPRGWVEGDASSRPEGDGMVYQYDPMAAAGGPMWTVRCVVAGRRVQAVATRATQALGDATALARSLRQPYTASGG